MGDGAFTAVVPSDEDRAEHCNALQDAQYEGTEYDADERASAPEHGVQAAGQRSSSLDHLAIGGFPEHRAVRSGYQGVAQKAQLPARPPLSDSSSVPGSAGSDPTVLVFPEELLPLEATENDGDGDKDTNSQATGQTAMELPLGAPYEPATTRQAVQTNVLPLGHDLPMPFSCEKLLYAYLPLRGQQHDTEQQYNVHREGFNIASPIKLPSANFIRYDIAPVVEAKWMPQRSVCWARQTGKNELVEVAYVAASAHVRRDLLFTETFEKFKAADERSDSDRALHPEFVDSALFQDRETVLSTGRSVPRFQLGDVFLAVGDGVDVDLQDGTGARGAAVVVAYFAEAADGLNVDACQHAGDFVVK